jgi:hypothetical protein
MFTIGDQLSFDRETTINVAQYLKGEGLIQFRALGGGISITHHGIRQVEQLKADNLHITAKENHETSSTGKQDNQITSVNRGLLEFKSKIAEDMWKFFEIKACLIKFEDNEWKISCLQIILSNEKIPVKKSTLEEERLKLVLEVRPISELNGIIDQILQFRSLHISGLKASIGLMNSNWTYDLSQRSGSLNEFQIDYTCHISNIHGDYPDEMKKIELYAKQILPLRDRPYLDLRHACDQFLNIKHGTSAFGLSATFIAPIYVKFENIEFTDNEVKVSIYSSEDPKNSKLRLNLFGIDEDGEPNEFANVTEDFETSQMNNMYWKKIYADQKSTALTAQIYYKKTGGKDPTTANGCCKWFLVKDLN